jgi:hypothetical protein
MGWFTKKTPEEIELIKLKEETARIGIEKILMEIRLRPAKRKAELLCKKTEGKSYFVLNAGSPVTEDLNFQVNFLISKGWKPLGAPFTNFMGEWFQALTKV